MHHDLVLSYELEFDIGSRYLTEKTEAQIQLNDEYD